MARENANRAFQYAHILVDYHVTDMRALEQRLDRRDQNCIVSTDELAHSVLPFAAKRAAFA